MRGARGAGALLLALLVGSSAEFLAGAAPAAALSLRPPRSASLGAQRGSLLQLSEPGYKLVLDAPRAELTVESPAGGVYTRLPLLALAGRTLLPRGLEIAGERTARGLVETVRDGGLLLSRVTLDASPTYFTVSFETELGPELDLSPEFFFDGETGVDWSDISRRLSPDPRRALLSTTPETRLGPGSSFSPPPLDLELEAPPGWLGLGLVQVPDATELEIAANGAVGVNYPLSVISTFHDRGAGGRVGESDGHLLLEFPSFVLTFSNGPWDGLTAYHDALRQLGFAPQAAPPGTWAKWWSQPIVDTWGQEEVEGIERRNPHYTVGWVSRYVAAWKRRYGENRFTLVVDSQWQARIGRAEPSSRFGGVTGMRRLIDQLHAEGIHVLLWWPLWVLGPRCQAAPPGVAGCPSRRSQEELPGRNLLDPTAPGFPAQLRHQIQLMLGSGAGDLDANGLKIDWGQITPDPNLVHADRPQLGVGAAGLLRYLQMIYSDARSVRKGALVESSAVSPQFGGTLDMLRLYDARGEATWQTRARIISATDPGTLIDGDDWPVRSGQAVVHAITSTVYGTPASYFLTRWFDGVPISRDEAHVLGQITGLAELKGQGYARPSADGGWRYLVGGRLRATTLAQSTAVAVYSQARCGEAGEATVVSAVDQRLRVPDVVGSGEVEAIAGRPLRLKVPAQVCASPKVPSRGRFGGAALGPSGH